MHVALSCCVWLGILGAPGALEPYHPMVQAKEKVEQAFLQNQRPTVLIRLEGALFDTRTRTVAIVQEFGQRVLKTLRPEMAQRLIDLTPAMVGPTIQDTLHAGLLPEEAIRLQAIAYWAERFSQDAYAGFDTPVPGGVQAIRQLYGAGAKIVYLSTRDNQRQLVGTMELLRTHGLPIGIPATELICKPTAATSDSVFLQQTIHYLRQAGPIAVIVESHGEQANLWRKAFPTSLVVHAPIAPVQSTSNKSLLPQIITMDHY